MNDYGRRVVVDLEFETLVGETRRAIREEGLQVIARIDVRDHFWRELGHDFRQYILIDAWSSELALEALRHNLETGTILPTRFAIYELADGEGVVVAKPPFSEPGWRRDAPALADMADRECELVARILERIQHYTSKAIRETVST